ncbi:MULTISPECIES: YceI family protein [unclassified Flavobacterium]|uniref:YceI family protein n=1 Tax=unclassified Flavobacterium TaxID=196869 RepID=UPI0009643216|nr:MULTISPECIES: YceI family protein [unclassified Flavobacterium]MBN9285454.1 YceI family protein [Flavobacterium sp.]OJV71445.1 MAG: hypothetical protein BGO42_06210 [Flavobacterium sp. 40-81]
MKKNFFLMLLLLTSISFYGQKYITKTGNLKFEASVASFEEVAAENKNTSAVLEASTGEVAVLALMKGFRFKVALMEEHFNENYMESDKFPKATFKGKIEDFDLEKTVNAKSCRISGDLTLHGKTRKITTTAKITRSGNTITLAGNFEVTPADFAIEIPGLVRKKVADKIQVTYNLPLTNK